jgi:hypothetical protein
VFNTFYEYIIKLHRTAIQPNTIATVTSKCLWCACGANTWGAIKHCHDFQRTWIQTRLILRNPSTDLYWKNKQIKFFHILSQSLAAGPISIVDV